MKGNQEENLFIKESAKKKFMCSKYKREENCHGLKVGWWRHEEFCGAGLLRMRASAEGQLVRSTVEVDGSEPIL